jgi:hypothetical protein
MSYINCNVIDREVISYYRCPETYGTTQIDGSADPSPGKFRLHDAIDFGQCSTCASRNVTGHECGEEEQTKKWVTLPRLAGEIVQNLRLERYMANPSRRPWRAYLGELQRQAYYALRPALGVSIRKHLQRRALRGWNEIPFPRWPVDRTADQVLEKFLELSMKAHEVERVPFIWFWPEGYRSCCIMTHDVEETEGVRDCDALMDLDNGAGLTASFQFVPEGRYTVPKALLDRVRYRGFEVNVHDLNHDGHLYDSREEFLRRAERINEYALQYGAKGFRSAVLYRNLNWYDAFTFDYDMSVPSVAHLDPQRGGCCTILPYFIGNIVELPLTTIQDYSLFNILDDYSITLWKIQADYIVRNHGLLSFNIHPDYLAGARARSTYVNLLRHLAGLRDEGLTYIARPGEVAEWWRQRSQMNLVNEAGHWRIIGSGSERAVVAYAFAERDGVSYSFDQPVVV